MEFRIEVLGPFKLVNLRDGASIPLRSNAKILAYLAVQAPQPVSRRAVVHELWPGVEAEVANNRLRVALAKLRQLLPNAIVESQDGLTLHPDVVECDARVFRAMVDESRDTSREEDEFDGLQEAYRYFYRNVRGSGFESWPLEVLKEPIDTFHTVCIRMAELGLKLRRTNIVSEICARALLLWPRDTTLWKAMLEARNSLGQGEAAVREISATKDRALLTDKEVRPVIDRILKGDSDETRYGVSISASEANL
ncbi:MAG: winged helix-turn-helix domain-containing protein, partial [Chlorobia bacterium]|nr:winged helix-turn-helix domain-containing protein [Fimbriimonadaceae bacterium]